MSLVEKRRQLKDGAEKDNTESWKTLDAMGSASINIDYMTPKPIRTKWFS